MSEAKSPVALQQNQNPHQHATAIVISVFISLTLAIAAFLVLSYLLTPRIAFIETGRLTVGFSEAAKAEKEFKAEDERWRGELKTLEDSVKVQIDRMTKEYNRATPARKRELQDLLSASNARVNNFKQGNMRRMQELNQKKTDGVVRKMNAYMAEYGKQHRYNIIFATANGNIVYGNGKGIDITDEIIKGLNERYK